MDNDAGTEIKTLKWKTSSAHQHNIFKTGINQTEYKSSGA